VTLGQSGHAAGSGLHYNKSSPWAQQEHSRSTAGAQQEHSRSTAGVKPGRTGGTARAQHVSGQGKPGEKGHDRRAPGEKAKRTRSTMEQNSGF